MGFLLPRVKNKLAAFILCEDSSMEDEICWRREILGMFSVTSEYDIISHLQEGDTKNIQNQIWKL